MGTAAPHLDDDLQSISAFENISNISYLLNSWKEVAVYLGRGARTVQRWEHCNGLPVYRYGNSPRAAVFAFKGELLNW